MCQGEPTIRSYPRPRKALKDIARVAKPDILLAWYRRLVAQKFDGTRHRAYPGRPRVSPEVEALVVRFARENPSRFTIAAKVDRSASDSRSRLGRWALRMRFSAARYSFRSNNS
jgi:hypothetical protein